MVCLSFLEDFWKTSRTIVLVQVGYQVWVELRCIATISIMKFAWRTLCLYLLSDKKNPGLLMEFPKRRTWTWIFLSSMMASLTWSLIEVNHNAKETAHFSWEITRIWFQVMTHCFELWALHYKINMLLPVFAGLKYEHKLFHVGGWNNMLSIFCTILAQTTKSI